MWEEMGIDRKKTFSKQLGSLDKTAVTQPPSSKLLAAKITQYFLLLQ